MSKFFFLIILVVNCFVCAYSQILLKKSAKTKYESKISQYINLQVIIAYCLFFVVLLINSLLMKKLPLMLVGPILESLPFVFILILSFFMLKEKITKKKLSGSLIIIMGIILIGI